MSIPTGRTTINTTALFSGSIDPGQTVAIATATDSLGESFTLQQTAGAGTLSESFFRNVETIYYTAPATPGLDAVSYTLTGVFSHATARQSAQLAVNTLPTTATATPAVLEAGQSTLLATVTPGSSGPVQVIALDDASAAALSTTTNADGSVSIIFQAPAGTGSTSVSVNYAVGDTVGGPLVSYSTNVQLDGGPVLTAVAAPAGSVEANTSIVIGSVAAGLAGDTLRLTQTAGSLGSVSLGAVVNGAQQVIYTGARSVNAVDAVGYTITDQLGGTVSGTAAVQLDKGATVTQVPAVVSHGSAGVIVDTIVAGLPGDVLSLTQTVAGKGSFTLVANGTDATGANKYNVLYTQTGAFNTTSRDTATFTVIDRVGGKVAGDTPTIILDNGPKLATPASGRAAPGQTVVVGTVTAGNTGDTLSVAGSDASHGTFALGDMTASGSRSVLFTEGTAAPTGSVSFTVTDQFGNVAAGTTALTHGTVVSYAGSIAAATAGATYDITAAPTVSITAANVFLFVESRTGTVSVNDRTANGGAVVDVATSTAKLVVTGFGTDAGGLVDLLYGAGGFTTTAQAQAALVSDGHGGSLLSLGSGASAGSIDFVGLSASAAAAHLKVG